MKAELHYFRVSDGTALFEWEVKDGEVQHFVIMAGSDAGGHTFRIDRMSGRDVERLGMQLCESATVCALQSNEVER